MGAHDAIAGPLYQHLLSVALRRGCTVDELSAGDVFDAEQLALECYRRGLEDGAADASTQPRAEIAELRNLAIPRSSGVRPSVRGVWEQPAEAVTPLVTPRR